MNVIEGALLGYDFGSDKKNKLVKLFSMRVRDREIFDEFEIYKYVTETLERWGTSYTDRFARSLNSPISFDTETLLSDFIGAEDIRLSAVADGVTDNGVDNKEYLTLSEAVEILRGELDDLDYRILTEVAQKANGDLELKLSQDELLGQTQDLVDRLHYVSELFYHNGIVIPRKTIAIVSYNPLKFRIGRLDDETVGEIYEAHKLGLNSSQAASYARTSRFTIWEYWSARGLKSPNRSGSKLSKDKVDKIVKAYSIYGGNAAEAARNLLYGRSTIMRYWNEYDLHSTFSPLGGPSFNKLSSEEVEEIIEEYTISGGNASSTSKVLGHCHKTVKKYLKSNGLMINSRTLTSQQIAEIVRAHGIFGGNAAEVSRNLPYGLNTIKRYWHSHGLTPQSLYSNLTSTEIDEVIRGYSKFGGDIKIASRVLPYSYSTIKLHWKKAGLLKVSN